MSTPTSEAKDCKRHKWTVVPNSNFVREHHNYSQGTVRLTAMQRVKCDVCGVVKSRIGGSLA
jgi:hypothetical protein